MPRPTTSTIIIALASIIGVAALVFLIGARSRDANVWTDGGSIRVAAPAAPLREVLWTPATPLPGVGHGSTDEYEPRFSADGATLVFVRRRAGENADLVTSRWSPIGWSEPTPIDSINTEHDELGPELSRDGSSLYFYSDRPGGLGGYDLWVALAIDSEWGTPINLGPRINSPWNEYGPALTPDAAHLYFSSNRTRAGEPALAPKSWGATVREHRARHDYDLYRADLSERASSEPAPLAALNTASDEGAPAVSPAGDFLYFASDRDALHAAGAFDLYRARIAPNETPSAPENLGHAINSAANDLDPALSSDGFRLCFSSDRAAPPTIESHPGRYTLWSSVSREVYRDIERASADSTAWTDLWPWLLLLTLLAALTWILVRLLRDERWRRRFGQLSLIAQCLLLSLLVHAAIASLLTIWKVGSGIIDLIQHDGGGTRVVLASGAPGGSIVSQVRGIITSAPVALPELAAMSASMPPALIESTLTAMPPPELAASDAPPVELDRPRPDRDPFDRRALSVPDAAQSSAPRAALPPAADPQPVRAEPITPNLPSPTIAAVPPARALLQMETTPIAVDLPQSTAQAVPLEAADAPRQSSERDLIAVATPNSPSLPALAQTSAPALPTVHAATEQHPEPVALAGHSIPTLAAAPASPTPTAAPAESAIADVAPPPMSTAGRNDASPVNMIGVDATGARGARAEPFVPTSPSAPATHSPTGAAQPGIPRLASIAPASAAEASLPAAASGNALLRRTLPVPTPTAHTRASVFTSMDPVDPIGASRNADLLGLDALPSSAASARESTDSPSASSLPLPSAPADADARLPAEPVIPVETFDQRAPEVRDELVRQMGGSTETERAVGLALDWFSRHQEADGHWSAQNFDDGCGRCDHPAEFRADAAMTGMALLCYLGAGHTHTQPGPCRDAVDRALRWLVARQSADGDLRQGETMYGQTVSTVALCEALAMTRDQALALPAQRAVRFVLSRASSAQRGDDRETSVLGWLVFTVESARRAGIDAPRSTFAAAGKWLDYVSIPGSSGLYSYSKGRPPSAAMTAEAMFVRQLLGHSRDEPMMERSARFILDSPPDWKDGAPTYHWYYATLALFQHQGDQWKAWNELLVTELLEHQRQEGPASGSWEPQDQWSRMGGRIYQTAVCTLCLEVYYRYKAE